MQVNTLILGAGAAGLMCAAHAGPKTLIIDHAKKPGEKIRISGGGRCNFTNMYCTPENFLSENPHFAKSALARYTQWDFIELVAKHGIAYHEKTLGQLFCDGKSTQIIDMLLAEMARAEASLWLETSVISITHDGSDFTATLEYNGKRKTVLARNLVLATGGKSIPKMGATGLAYDIAEQFGHSLTKTRPALVPFTFSDNPFTPLAGTAADTIATAGHASFEDATLFTHRGLSGPAMLQISSYWHEGEAITLNLDPANTLYEALRSQRQTQGRRQLTTELARHLPAKLVDHLTNPLALTGNLADQSDARLSEIVSALQNWQLKPTATEGYRTAEVTLGGVSTADISSRSMESAHRKGLYFIGECVDVTGWLGGFNFQWAWSSAVAAARDIASRAQSSL
ncbi:NAD(P)/FAD-dependent oxidoreductase [Lentibacter sp. XHP0401]|uniref:NAD(P)/FAD-dependent oxidoreductase n=1 Tax=Lentibacter sp. XHP0401 TaxID=2984334 RepID=UPI0021E914A4|nr:NAD(P)/FAD-dependent oxidoreductase [Lentibacter sp. XHP0401]MCV2891627.1 NAD(P)/FAD-dependent oxidoreductase [Lentibacter sp. XHP0401]